MLKKVAVVAVVGLAGAAVLTQTKVGSQIMAMVDKVEGDVSEAVPADWELQRIKFEIGKLDNDIESAKGQLAKVNVDTDLLRQEVDNLRRDAEAGEKWLLERGEALKKASAADRVKWNRTEVTLEEAKQLLQTEVSRLKHRKDELTAKEKTLTIQQKNRDALDRQLQALIHQKREMASAVKNLEATINLAKLEQTESQFQNDGSRLADIKKSMRDLERRVAVQREKLDLARRYDAPADDASGKSVDEILSELKPAAQIAGAQ